MDRQASGFYRSRLRSRIVYPRSGPLAPEVVARLRAEAGSFKLLFVSHYNYYRNFETLIRALPQIRQLHSGRPVKLLLTCSLAAGTDNLAIPDRKRGGAHLD